MSYIDSAKRYPGVYAIFALVNDEAEVDRDRAEKMFGHEAVELATTHLTQGITPDDVRLLMANLALHLGAATQTPTTPTPASQVGDSATGGNAATQVATAPAPAPAATAPTASVYYPRKTNRVKGPTRHVTGLVEVVTTEARKEEYGGGVRHVMVVREPGKPYGLRGTIPQNLVGNVREGDGITMQAEVIESQQRFKYPKNAVVVR
jgi:hypothetical protein